MPEELLPLFPLDVVLLPGAPLPLHVFEERYKLMIGECLKERREFGVVRAQESHLETVGCTAEIVNVVKRYPDGRMDILTVGVRAFEILAVNQEMPYLRAEWAPLEDEDEGKPERENAQRALILFQQALELLAPRTSHESELGADSLFLSFRLAAYLPLEDDAKQRLLALHSEADRLQQLTDYLGKLLPQLERARKLRRKVGGNGQLR